MEGTKKMKIKSIIALGTLACLLCAQEALAFTGSEAQLEAFLEGIADFLIRVIGPGILVIGVCFGGISMATGNERGLQRGIMAALGGAFIMMSRSILDLIQRLTGF